MYFCSGLPMQFLSGVDRAHFADANPQWFRQRPDA